jgi:dihydrofolate synthase/folylpolyglutamate synthase
LKVNPRESFDFLFGLRASGIKLGLQNISALLDVLGQPHKNYAVVHIAGTNGKGSVAAGLAEILRRAGYRTGLFTSPHLQSFTERIRIDGRPAAEEELAVLISEIRILVREKTVTFFEFATALAFAFFARHDVQVAVIETGMGGRLDATNLVTPLISVITPISPDHTRYLGSTLRDIAGEKAAIIKKGIPSVLGPQPPEVAAVLENRARLCAAPLSVFSRDFFVLSSGHRFIYQSDGLVLDNLCPGLAGRHQHANLALSLRCADILRQGGFSITENAMREGIKAVRWPGRLHWWQGRREILLDCAHNGGGAEALSRYLEDEKIHAVHWVVGIKGDKDVEAIFNPLLGRVKMFYCCAVSQEPLIPPARLAAKAMAMGLKSQSFTGLEEALVAARRTRRKNEIVLVAGSIFVVGAAMNVLGKREASG